MASTEVFFRLRGEPAIMTIATHPFLPIAFVGYVDGTVRAIDLESRSFLPMRVERTIMVGMNWCLAIDPSGTMLATGWGTHDHSVRIFLLSDTLVPLNDWFTSRHGSGVSSIMWDPSGRPVVASGSHDTFIKLWSPSGVLHATLEGHTGAVTSLASHPTERLFASGSHDKTVRVWSWDTHEQLAVLMGHEEPVNALVASDREILSASDDRTVRMWSWAGHALSVIYMEWSVDAMAWMNGGTKLATMDDSYTLRIFNAATWDQLASVEANSGALAVLHDGGDILGYDGENGLCKWHIV